MYINFIENNKTIEIVQIPDSFTKLSLEKGFYDGVKICNLVLVNLLSPEKERFTLCTFDAGKSEEANFKHASETLTKIMTALRERKPSVDIPMHYSHGFCPYQIHEAVEAEPFKIKLDASKNENPVNLSFKNDLKKKSKGKRN